LKTIIDPTSLSGGTTSPWLELQNAEITFSRVLTETVDPITGNPKPEDSESLTVPAYFKKARLATDEGKGVPVGSYKVEGYTVGILPDWAKNSNGKFLPCTVAHLGSGSFCFQGKIQVVKDLVELKGKGSQLQGYFTIQGSGS
jgi:hypothetical protein